MKYCFDVRQEYELFSGRDPEVFYCPVELEKLTLHRLTKERDNDPQFRAVCGDDGRPMDCKNKSEAYIALAAMLNEEVYEWLDVEREGGAIA